MNDVGEMQDDMKKKKEIGVTEAIFQVDGKTFVLIDKFMMYVMTETRVGPASLMSLAVKPSMPQAFDGESLFIKSFTVSKLVSVRLKVGGLFGRKLIGFICGKFAASFFPTSAKWVFIVSAMISGSVVPFIDFIDVVFDFKGQIIFSSFHVDLLSPWQDFKVFSTCDFCRLCFISLTRFMAC